MKERKIIIENLRMVDNVIIWDDQDNSACGAIDILLSDLKQEAKKRSDIENAASIYFEKAFQNLK